MTPAGDGMYVIRVQITFPEVHRLKYVSGRDSIRFSRLQELRDLLHLFEGHLCLEDLLDRLLSPRIQAVDKPTEDLENKIELKSLNEGF